MILAISVSCHTTVDCDSRSIGTLVNNTIREIQERCRSSKIVDVKLTSAATHGYINFTALILYKVKDDD